jgi:uncharacterized protein (TIGR03067 family)
MKPTAALLVCVLSIAADEKGAGKKAADPLEGTWSIVSDISNGQTLEVGADSPKVTFKAGKMRFEREGKPESGVATYKLLDGQKPAAIDITPPPGKSTVAVQEGVYSVKDGELRICLGKPRPKEFTATKDTILITLKRDKP